MLRARLFLLTLSQQQPCLFHISPPCFSLPFLASRPRAQNTARRKQQSFSFVKTSSHPPEKRKCRPPWLPPAVILCATGNRGARGPAGLIRGAGRPCALPVAPLPPPIRAFSPRATTDFGSSDSANGVGERVLSQLLNEMDGVADAGQVLVVACTNRPDRLDAALLRPGTGSHHAQTC